MKITPAKIENFLDDPKIAHAALLYGNDHGKISLYAEKLSNNLKLGPANAITNIINLPPASLKQGALITEINSISMLGDKKIIIIKEVNESAFSDIQQALLRPPQDCYIIVTSHKLSVKSKLNQLFEKSESMASIGCWQESGKELEQFIRKNLGQYRLDNSLVKKLAEYLQGDTLFALSELNKLSLYLVNKPNATEEEIINCIVDSGEKTLDSLCLAAADRDIPKFIALSEELLSSISPISAIRVLYNYFYRLEKTLSLVQQGLNMQQAISRLKPPVFFKNMHHFKRHLTEWRVESLREMLKNMLELEINCKQNANPKHIFKQSMIITILESK